MDVFDDIMDDVSSDIKIRFDLPDEAEEWVRNMMQYNVPGGKVRSSPVILYDYSVCGWVDGWLSGEWVGVGIWVGVGLCSCGCR